VKSWVIAVVPFLFFNYSRFERACEPIIGYFSWHVSKFFGFFDGFSDVFWQPIAAEITPRQHLPKFGVCPASELLSAIQSFAALLAIPHWINPICQAALNVVP